MQFVQLTRDFSLTHTSVGVLKEGGGGREGRGGVRGRKERGEGGGESIPFTLHYPLTLFVLLDL